MLQNQIETEFSDFLIYTTIPAFFIILSVTALLTLYAYLAISKRINALTKMVDNPHEFKHANTPAASAAALDKQQIEQ